MKKEFDKRKITKVAIAWVAIIVAIYLVVLVVNILRKPTDTFVIEKGKIYQEEFAEGYIIRSEALINIGNAENGLVAIKAEGDKVGKGEAVYRYCVENEDEINDKIKSVDEQIQENLNNDEDYFSADIKLINTQIDAKLDNLYESDNLQKIKQEKNDINTYLNKKIKIRAEDSNNATLKKLVNERDNYEKQLNEKSTYIQAENSGVVSYRVDGLEESLKNDDLSYLNEEYLKNLDLETGKIIASSTDSGKIVDNFKCNIVCILDSDEAKECKEGKSIKIRLQNSQEISAKIIQKVEQPSGKEMIVFEIIDDVVELMKYRKISFDVIWWSDSGLKIPNSAIKYEGDFAYVIRNRAGLKEKILIKVLRSNDKYSIVENYTYAELKEAGYDMSTLSGRKTISVYDQVEN
ncbi:MAG: hypothetical protein IKE01_05415 [Clostridia bacterium]|nr:hypothetical protein [Clostridia bacterium]